MMGIIGGGGMRRMNYKTLTERVLEVLVKARVSGGGQGRNGNQRVANHR